MGRHGSGVPQTVIDGCTTKAIPEVSKINDAADISPHIATPFYIVIYCSITYCLSKSSALVSYNPSRTEPM